MSEDLSEHHDRFGKIYEAFEFWPRFKAGDTVLDLGCGNGLLTRKLAKLNPDANFVGVDHRQSSVEIARKKAQAEGLDNANFSVGDITTWHCSTPVEGIFGRFIIEDLKEPANMICKMHESLKPGGWACVAERLNAFSKVYPRSHAIEEVWDAVFAIYRDRHGKNPDITNNIVALFRDAGFQDVEIRGFSQVLDRRGFGGTFDWYVGIALGILSSIRLGPDHERSIDQFTIERAESDYKNLLVTEGAFVLECAVAIYGKKAAAGS